jgi:hypoxanthine phosphoribosyltransferase
MLSIPLHYREDLESVLIPHGLISDRTERLANEIIDDHLDQPLVCFCVLKGGYKFFSSLIEKIQNRNRNTSKRSMPMIINFIKTDVIIVNLQILYPKNILIKICAFLLVHAVSK